MGKSWQVMVHEGSRATASTMLEALVESSEPILGSGLLAQRSGYERSCVSRALGKLSEVGLVAIEQTGRFKRISLTPAGRKVAEFLRDKSAARPATPLSR